MIVVIIIIVWWWITFRFILYKKNIFCGGIQLELNKVIIINWINYAIWHFLNVVCTIVPNICIEIIFYFKKTTEDYWAMWVITFCFILKTL